MRGKHLIKQISDEIIPQAPPALFPEDKTLNDKRNELLIARYYFYLSERKHTTDMILLKLQEEFFISTGRITDILKEKTPAIQELRKQKPEKAWYRQLAAHFVW